MKLRRTTAEPPKDYANASAAPSSAPSASSISMSSAMPERECKTPAHSAPPDLATVFVRRSASPLVRDQQRRWEAGDPVPVEFYLRQQPNLRSDCEALLDLICSEWALREQHGDSLDIEEYVA